MEGNTGHKVFEVSQTATSQLESIYYLHHDSDQIWPNRCQHLLWSTSSPELDGLWLERSRDRLQPFGHGGGLEVGGVEAGDPIFIMSV